MDNREKDLLRMLEKERHDADLFWQLSDFIAIMTNYNETDAERIKLLQERARDLQAQALEHRYRTGITIDELKADFLALLDRNCDESKFSQNNYRDRNLAAIRSALADRGVPHDWYYNES